MQLYWDVIVIGAGLAGLAAAHKLQNAGLNVVVLEARDEAGGRTRSTTVLGPPVDIGASWLHGIRDHPLYDHGLRQSLAMVKTNYDHLGLYDQQGVADSTPVAILEKFEKALYTLGRGAKRRHSIADRLSRLAPALHSRIPESTRTLTIATVIEEEYAADISELAALALEEGRDMRGADAILCESYTALVQPMADQVNLRLNQEVYAIDYGGRRIFVSTKSDRFEAGRVIVTVPLGVLKQGNIAFTPPLDARKKAAINDLGMGLSNKLYLKFSRVFWDTGLDVVSYAHSQRGRWVSWYNYAGVTGEPILLGFCAADAARHVEALTDEETVADAMAVLKTIYGADIPEPSAYYMTRWGSDPWSRGSYSFLRVGAKSSQRKHLAQAVADKLMFAGEATDTRYPATTQGAYRSGRRAAQKVLKHYQGQSASAE
ncbi:MAG: monoamine oxidase [Halioglobus sp.]|jgi:monoamine oxidase